MNCPKCNKPLEPDSKFCKHCGTAIGSVVTASPPVAALASEVAATTTASVATPNPYRDPAFEKEVWTGRPAWRAAYGLWFLWAVGGIAAIYAVTHFEAGETVKKGAWLLIGIAAVFILLRQASVILSRHYRLTTQRLFIERGVVAKVTDQMELVRIDDVRMRQGIIDRLVNTGDIEIIGSDKTDESIWLESIGNPAEVTEAIRRNVRASRAKGALFVENV